MPVRLKRNKLRHSTHMSPEAVELFKRGFDLQRGPLDPCALLDIKVALATALGRSKFAACPLDREPRSLIGCDREPVGVVLGLRAQMFRKIVEERL